MKSRITIATAAALAALLLSGCSLFKSSEPFQVERENIAVVTAQVKSVNLETREVVLVGANGKQVLIDAGPEVRNLGQLRPGDIVVAQYRETFLAEVRKPTDEEKANPVEVIEGGERAALGDLPGAAGVQALRFVGKISAIDKETMLVSFTSLDGQKLTVEAQDPENLDRVKVGDPVVLIFAEAVAITVEPLGER